MGQQCLKKVGWISVLFHCSLTIKHWYAECFELLWALPFPQFYTEPWAMCTYFDFSWCEVNICDMWGLFWLSQGRRADCDQGQTRVRKSHVILKLLGQGVLSSYLKRKSTALPKTYNLSFSTSSIFIFCFWSVQILIRHHVSSFSNFPEQLSKVFLPCFSLELDGVSLPVSIDFPNSHPLAIKRCWFRMGFCKILSQGQRQREAWPSQKATECTIQQCSSPLLLSAVHLEKQHRSACSASWKAAFCTALAFFSKSNTVQCLYRPFNLPILYQLL